ncbi:type II secretion system F family protein [Arthrobacter agilis]|uniref:type II secretion system F family protein n=1 Tax=Arthrobacter agilis TaxID=37921 RepID=UPI002366C834|nr:type II secretion system F family protein [Arthrobacter agilis]WDF32888.1 type II secretion system F family protein [Arthrobacter agilis]
MHDRVDTRSGVRLMTGLIVALLLGAAVVTILSHGGTEPRGGPRGGHERAVRRTHPQDLPTGLGRLRIRLRRQVLDVHDMPLFIHQLAGLLRAGRPPHLLWSDMERVYSETPTVFARTALPVIATARRAADLGLSVPDALRAAGGRATGQARAPVNADRAIGLWVDLAGCLVVAERSGVPLAAILERYATHLEAGLDSAAARETVLAGPRATVVLLAWLPVIGLVLGFALGVDPVQVLLGSPLGLLTLGTGAVLMVVARLWSRRLVQRAVEPS